jgi:hypothetical protein
MIVVDPNTGELVNVPDPRHIRVPFLNHQVGLGDSVAAATQAMGVQPCTPCEERKRKLNQMLQFDPWRT